MGAPQEILQLLKQGLSPGETRRTRQQAGKGSSVNTIIPYIDSLIGAGDIRRSDVLFTIKLKTRREIEVAIGRDQRASDDQVARSLVTAGTTVDPADVAAFRRYGDARFSLGDMYENVRAIEVGLHKLVRAALEARQPGGRQWWTDGVPSEIRLECERRRGRDKEPAEHSYNYTDLLHIREIVNRHWDVIAAKLPAGSRKAELHRDLGRLNRIRRMVMHPSNGRAPSDEDFEFVRAVKKQLGF